MKWIGWFCLVAILAAAGVVWATFGSPRFGYTGTATTSATIDEQFYMGRFAPDSSGIIDTIGAKITNTSMDSTHIFRAAVYTWRISGGAAATLIDTSAQWTRAGGLTPAFMAAHGQMGGSVTAGTWYGIAINANKVTGQSSTGKCYLVSPGVLSTDSVISINPFTGAWPTTLSNTAGASYTLAGYCVYHTVATGGRSGRRRRIQISTNGPMSDEDIGPWADQTKTGTR